MKKKFFLILIVGLLLLVISGCNQEPKEKIGFSIYDMKFDFFKEMEKGTRTHLNELGYDLITHDQKSSTDAQISGCMELLDQGIAALIVSPINSEAMEQITEEAHKRGVPVIINDVGGGDSDYDAFVVSDCIEGGRMAGEYLHNINLEKSETIEPKVIVIRNNPEVSAAYSRGDGFLEIASEYNWMVLADVVGEGEGESAYLLMKDMLEEYAEIDAVFCTNDPMAVAVSDACIEAGRKDIKIIGFNGDLIALKAIREGRMLATIQQFPYAMGEIAADLVDMTIRDQDIDFDIEETKTVLIPVKLIDQTNVNDAFEALH